MEPLQKLSEKQKAENARRKREVLEEGEREKVKAQGGRTDEEITCQAPLKVVLGGQEMELPILAYNPCREWREKHRDTMKTVQAQAKMAEGKTKEELSASVSVDEVPAFVEKTERILLDDKVDLVVLYLELTGVAGAEILDVATQPELIAAYEAIEKVASPLSLAPVPQA